MRSVTQVVGGFLATGLLALGGAGGAGATSTVSADTPDDAANSTAADATLGEFGACLAGGGETPQGQLVLLLDRSSSLEQADPQQERRQASKYLVDQLTDYVETADADIDIQIAGFADDYTAGDWTQLSTDQQDALHTQIDEYTDQLVPIDTDYVNAFTGARRSLSENRGDYPSNCQAIAWFTDGAFYIDPRTTSEDRSAYGTQKPYAPDLSLETREQTETVRDVGQEEFCRPQGTMDQVRAEGITVFGFALSSVEDDWDFMRNAVEATDCGDITEPVGTFFEAADASELVLAFDAIAQPGHPPFQYSSVPVCDGTACDEGFISFTLDDAISKIQILAMSRDTNARPVFVMPDGQTADAGDADFPFDLEQLTEHTVSVQLDKADAAEWEGGWKLAMVTSDSAGAAEDFADISIRLRSSVAVQWPDELTQKARVGEVLDGVQLRLMDAEVAEEIDPDALQGSVAVESQLIDAAGNAYPIISGGADELKTPIEVDLTEAAVGPATIDIETQITTAAATDADGNDIPGTDLQPVRSQVSLDLQPPANFPQVLDTAAFDALDGTTQSAGSVDVTGPGCVWLDDSEITTSPTETSALNVTSEHNSTDTCMTVQDGDTVAFPLLLELDTPGNGGINGQLTLQTAPLDEVTRSLPATVGFNAQAMKPLDTTRATVTTVIAVVVGIAIPLVLFYAIKFVTARIPRATYRYAVVEVPRDGGQGIALPPQNEIPTVHHDGSSRIALGRFNLQARMSWSPFQQTPVRVVGSAQPSVGSPRAAHHRGQAVLPQDISSQWVIRQVSENLFEVLLILDGATSTMAADNWRATVASVQSGFDDAVATLDRIVQSQSDDSSKGGTPEKVTVGTPASSAAGSSDPFGSSASSADDPFSKNPFDSPGSSDPFGNDPFGSHQEGHR